MEKYLVEHGAAFLYESQVTGTPSLQFPRPAGQGLVFFAVGETQTARKDFRFGRYGQEFDVKKGDKITLKCRGNIAYFNVFEVER